MRRPSKNRPVGLIGEAVSLFFSCVFWVKFVHYHFNDPPV